MFSHKVKNVEQAKEKLAKLADRYSVDAQKDHMVLVEADMKKRADRMPADAVAYYQIFFQLVDKEGNESKTLPLEFCLLNDKPPTISFNAKLTNQEIEVSLGKPMRTVGDAFTSSHSEFIGKLHKYFGSKGITFDKWSAPSSESKASASSSTQTPSSTPSSGSFSPSSRSKG